MHKQSFGLRLGVFALSLASTAFIAPDLAAQSLVRGSGVIGLPDVQIDLSTRAAKRYAFVIGNSDYTVAPDLRNADADARLMAAFLREQGYEVFEYTNLTKRGFEDMLRRVLFDVDKQSEVVFYFAGHGLQIGGGNYIVPADADLNTAYDVPFETVSLDSLVAIIGARARTQLVILDSCRNNPFANQTALTGIGDQLSEARNGFSTLAAPVNSLLAFSTSPGEVALDGDGANSPFTAALIEAANANPDASVTSLLEQVRRLVYERTGGAQVPWESSTLVETISFVPSQTVPPVQTGDGSGSVTRALVLIESDEAPTATPAQQQPVDVVLSAELSREVDLNDALRQGLALSDSDTLSITGQPDGGRLTIVTPGGIRLAADATGVIEGATDQILYSNAMPQTDAAFVEGAAYTDDFRVAVNGDEQVVRIALQGNECDMEAGDHLDPEGSGLTRYANEIRPEIALAACLKAVEASPQTGRFHYQLGRAYLALRRYDEANAAFEKARDLGHTRAWVALGAMIADQAAREGGKANVKDPDEALAYYIIGVDQGDPYAYYALGRQLLRYETNEELRRQGFDLMMRALEVGHTFAMNELGYFYLDEENPFFDSERGLRYLRESAARDDIYGYNNMGLVYRNGLGGTAVDYQKAFDWFEKAALGGHPNAPGNIGLLYERGQLGRGKADEAMHWYQIGLERGDPWAGVGAAYVILDQRPDGFERYQAAIFAAKAAALRDPEAGDAARQILRGMNRRLVDQAAQQMIADLGVEITVDGAFGAGSRAALAQVAANFGVEPPENNRVDRLVFLAGLYWTTSPFRVDLY